MGILAGTGPCSLLTPSTNLYAMVVASALILVGTTALLSIIPPVDMLVSLLDSLNMPQSPPPRLLICVVYPPSRTFSLILSGSEPNFGCGMLGGGGWILRKSA